MSISRLSCFLLFFANVNLSEKENREMKSEQKIIKLYSVIYRGGCECVSRELFVKMTEPQEAVDGSIILGLESL